ncbi:hypothetical protein BJ875DRAFT_453187 [Amylocarpus encephaloides]|uniref:Uncharacterized protein n=1 Tax=Amylocarpus encephaloides TaxID=45428 RepID=A0A9P8C8S7_9HELO|nr:hypothetical protein BJ875DRAFT_453187 [Amylocarpus encephaloides]
MGQTPLVQGDTRNVTGARSDTNYPPTTQEFLAEEHNNPSDTGRPHGNFPLILKPGFNAPVSRKTLFNRSASSNPKIELGKPDTWKFIDNESNGSSPRINNIELSKTETRKPSFTSLNSSVFKIPLFHRSATSRPKIGLAKTDTRNKSYSSNPNISNKGETRMPSFNGPCDASYCPDKPYRIEKEEVGIRSVADESDSVRSEIELARVNNRISNGNKSTNGSPNISKSEPVKEHARKPSITKPTGSIHSPKGGGVEGTLVKRPTEDRVSDAEIDELIRLYPRKPLSINQPKVPSPLANINTNGTTARKPNIEGSDSSSPGDTKNIFCRSELSIDDDGHGSDTDKDDTLKPSSPPFPPPSKSSPTKSLTSTQNSLPLSTSLRSQKKRAHTLSLAHHAAEKLAIEAERLAIDAEKFAIAAERRALEAWQGVMDAEKGEIEREKRIIREAMGGRDMDGRGRRGSVGGDSKVGSEVGGRRGTAGRERSGSVRGERTGSMGRERSEYLGMRKERSLEGLRIRDLRSEEKVMVHEKKLSLVMEAREAAE